MKKPAGRRMPSSKIQHPATLQLTIPVFATYWYCVLSDSLAVEPATLT